jgi:diaminopimelate epimerase
MNFIKMEGLGNDFIITHDVKEKDISSLQNQIVKLCDRRKGIGADGVIFVLESSVCDYKMRIFNSDGSEAEMCGNGIRCFAIYVNLLDLNSSPKLTIETPAGKKTTEVVGNNRVTVNMGVPVLDAEKIPVIDTGRVSMKQLLVDNREFAITCVSMGNPHAVIYPDTITDELVLGYGPKIEKHSYFPKKTNVEFVKVLSKNELQMRVWERGCGETLACGTGACATVVSGIINALHDKSVTVHLPGGDLDISWGGEATDPVMMTGPAEVVFEGSVRLD